MSQNHLIQELESLYQSLREDITILKSSPLSLMKAKQKSMIDKLVLAEKLNQLTVQILGLQESITSFVSNELIEDNPRHKKTNLTPSELELDAINVSSFDSIPNSPLYFVESCGLFAIKINNCIIHGHISDSSSDTNHIPCRKGLECKKNNCQYYHDPYTVPWSKDTPNLSHNSWHYNPNLTQKNRYQRHVGDRGNIKYEIDNAPKHEYQMFNLQTAHDILITLLLHKREQQ